MKGEMLAMALGVCALSVSPALAAPRGLSGCGKTPSQPVPYEQLESYIHACEGRTAGTTRMYRGEETHKAKHHAKAHKAKKPAAEKPATAPVKKAEPQ